jgi:hypothetical protein
MTPFITYRDNDESGELQYFVLQRAHPHYVGQIIDNPNFKAVYKVPIPQTSMFVAYYGDIEGRRFPMYINAEKEINAVLVNMAQWFFENRIKKNEKKYKKWLLYYQEQPTSY